MKILIEEQVVRQALEALGNARQRIQYMLNNGEWYSPEQVVDQADDAILALRIALDAAEGVNPVAWFCEDESTLSFAKMRGCDCIPLYPAPAVPEETK